MTAEFPVARTRHEAAAFLGVAACDCGERGAAWADTPVTLPDGAAGVRWSGRCAGCGRERAYVFRLPPWPQDVPDEEDVVVYGNDGRTSELLDPAEWLLVAERNVSSVPRDPERLQGAGRTHAWDRLRAASAALYEALRFRTWPETRIPAEAIRSDIGQRWLAEEPERFDVARIERQREAYDRTLRALRPSRPLVVHPDRQRQLDDPDRGTDPGSRMALDDPIGGLAAYGMVSYIVQAEWDDEPAERDRRLALVSAAYLAWRARHRIDDADWPAEILDLPRDRAPSAEVAWELVRTARTVAGLDERTGRRPR